MKMKTPASFRRIKVMIALFGIVLLSFLWFGLYFKVQSERQLEIDAAYKETGNYARTFEEHTIRTLDGLDQIALSLKYQVEKEKKIPDLPRLVREGRFAEQPFVLLSIQNETGDVIASSQVPFISANLNDREHFQVHKEADSGALFISKPVLGRVSGKWSIQLTRRVNKPDGSFGGIVVVSADPAYFAGYYKQINLGAGSSIALIGRDGFVRVRQTGENIGMGDDFRQTQLIKALSVSDAGKFRVAAQADGVVRLYSYRAVNRYPLVVVAGLSEADVLQEFNQRIVSYYWVCGTITLSVILFFGAIIFSIVRRKRIEEMLQESEERYRQLFEMESDAIFLIDAKVDQF